MRDRSAPRSAIILAVILAAAILPASAAVKTSSRSGGWTSPATWVGGVPQPSDEVVIASGHRVVFNQPANGVDECARLVIQSNGELVISGFRATFELGGNGAGAAGGVEVF